MIFKWLMLRRHVVLSTLCNGRMEFIFYQNSQTLGTFHANQKFKTDR